jgi:predicted esterase
MRLLLLLLSLFSSSCVAFFAATMSAAAPLLQETPTKMKRILCLHGRYQSGAILSNKIAGARRKLARNYELHFLDGPIVLEQQKGGEGGEGGPFLTWWDRNADGKNILIQEAFDHVAQETKGQTFDAIIGFSQGGVLATALALSGVVPGVRAVVTAGAPMVEEAFDIAAIMAACADENTFREGRNIPKLHLAGETDSMVPVESTRTLCESGGNGEFIVHEQGHLFPTRAVRVNYMMEFLAKSLED